MKNSTVKVKALAIDNTKNKIIYGALAFLVGLAAMALFSTPAHAEGTVVKDESPKKVLESEWTPHIQIQDEVKLPFELKSQKLSH